MKVVSFTLLIFLQVHLRAQKSALTSPAIQDDSIVCITKLRFLQYIPVDKSYQLVKKKAMKNLRNSIKACGYPYRFTTKVNDKAFRMLLPKGMNDYSASFGDEHFLISFDDGKNLPNCNIVLYYDMINEHKESLFKELYSGTIKYDSVVTGNKTMYLFKNQKKMYVGEIFLKNKMAVAYYTPDKKQEKQLRTCILSFRFD